MLTVMYAICHNKKYAFRTLLYKNTQFDINMFSQAVAAFPKEGLVTHKVHSTKLQSTIID